MNITLLGYMGVGKSTIGKKIAQELDLSFIDLDTFIEDMEEKSISEIFHQKGEIYFRKIENKYLKNFFHVHSNTVLSTGGGTPVYYNNLEIINENSFSIYLRGTPSTLAQRILPYKHSRPLVAHLKDSELPEFIAKHLFERNAFYEKAHLTLSTDGKSIHEITINLIESIKNHQNLS